MNNEDLREEILEETEKAQELPENEQTEENQTPPQVSCCGEEAEDAGSPEPISFNYSKSRFYKPLPKGVTEETYDEYLKIRSCGKILGISAIVIIAVVTAYSVVYGFIAGIFSAFNIDILKFLEDPAANTVTQIFFTIVMFTLPFVIAAWVNKYKLSDLVPLGKSREGTVLPYFLFGLGFCAFAQIAVSQAAVIFESMGFSYDLPESENPEGLFGFLLSVIATAVVPALMEEFGCRGIMFGIAEKKGGTTFALIVSSALFGLIHGNFVQIPFAFLVGLVLGVIRIKTGSLWVCILIHGVNNFVSIVMDYAFRGASDEIANMAYSIFLVLCMLASLLGVAIISKKKMDGEYDLIEAEDSEGNPHTVTLTQKLMWFFKSPAVLVAVILFVGEACLYFLV
ncbi:MAG: CPBP family intramembrane metalloprotease [Clostridia bacterium]|nr:CPBP family intramembrane metalloprotease [Clostridia bacterium]